ncbi:MAG TPA: putative porin [Vicinamibacteria bacterium]|nr:putative porin [Vicinamibacteria bacterium]
MEEKQEEKTAWRLATGARRFVIALLVGLGLLASPFISLARAQTQRPKEEEEQEEGEEQEEAKESAPAAQAQAPDPHAWKFSGDVRVRYERTTNQEQGDIPDRLEPRNRGVGRFRAGATKKFNDMIEFGARLTSGDPDDPNSTDVTFGDFADALTVSLDRLYIALNHRGAFLTGGKFANPFLTSELVWDGDVHPQGAGGSYTFSGLDKVTPKFTGLYFIVDESTIDPDSSMWGAQVDVPIRPSADWSIRLSGAYYDYTINSLIRADAGDIRGNRLTEDGRNYLSDFNLFDVVGLIDYRGFGARYPFRFHFDYVKNFGNADDEDGFGFDAFLGPQSSRGDLRYRYGYSQTYQDAVLAAFSHDNTTYATNYRQHTLTLDYLLYDKMQLNATYYIYKRLETDGPNDWITRLRLNALVSW